MRQTRKKFGCCTLCGREVFEILARWPKGHPLAGQVCQLGHPLPSARRATLVLMSGTIADVTLCDRCPPDPENLPALWKTCASANAQELDDEYREAIGVEPHNPQQHEAGVDNVRQMVADLPIAVLSVSPWGQLL
jgi:hypothetical protein